jgi:hypothetical protein
MAAGDEGGVMVWLAAEIALHPALLAAYTKPNIS